MPDKEARSFQAGDLGYVGSHLIGGLEGVDGQLDRVSDIDYAQRLLGFLSPIQRRVATLRYEGEEDTPLRVAKDASGIGLSYERVRQIEVQAKKRLIHFDKYLKMRAKYLGSDPTMALNDHFTDAGIVRAVSGITDIGISEIMGDRRLAEVVRARHIAMFMMYYESGKSYKKIGKYFRRDHTTVISGVSKIARKLWEEPKSRYVSSVVEMVTIQLRLNQDLNQDD